jgi:hypothetical protein
LSKKEKDLEKIYQKETAQKEAELEQGFKI